MGLKRNLNENFIEKEHEVPIAKKQNGIGNDDDDSDDGNEDDTIWSISDDEDDEDDDAEDDNVKIKKAIGGKKRALDNANESAPDNKKKRKLNQNGKKKKKQVDKQKLNEEMTEIITKILLKFPDGLDIPTIWRKIASTLSYDAVLIKETMKIVMKEICARTKTEIETTDGEKKTMCKYYLKKRTKK